MKEINMRFKLLREACKKTQGEFGKILGLSVSGVSDIERGKRNVTDQHLIMLSNWHERKVNIDWLRTGRVPYRFPQSAYQCRGSGCWQSY